MSAHRKAQFSKQTSSIAALATENIKFPTLALTEPSEVAGKSTASTAKEAAYVPDGFVDFYGYHQQAGGWFVAGWLTYPWPVGYRPENAIAIFADKTMIDCSLSLLNHRKDLEGRGIGFVFFFRSVFAQTGPLLSALVESGGVPHPIYPSVGMTPLDEQELTRLVEGLVVGGKYGSQQQQMRALLDGEPDDVPATGYIDFHGRHSAAGGWLFSGSVSGVLETDFSCNRAVVSFDEGDVEGKGLAVLDPRDDGEGIAFIVFGDNWPSGKLSSVSFESGNVRTVLYATSETNRLQGSNLSSQFRLVLEHADPGPNRDILSTLSSRQPYRGDDTLAQLSPRVLLEIDETIVCGRTGLALMGWLLALPNEISAIRVRSGSRISPLDVRNGIKINRPDVIEAVAKHGYSGLDCGFVVFLPDAVEPGCRVYIEIETNERELCYRNIPHPRLEGMAAITRLLADVKVRFSDVQRAFDLTLGPAVAALNQSRLAAKDRFEIVEYGDVPREPRFSVVVPLHGRLDFVEYQLGLFSAYSDYAEVEFIYVLDDPPKRDHARYLFASVFERFRIPFKAVILERNVGYAPANNIGLREAHGTFVAFVNSDVFPGTPDWLDRLSGLLNAEPSVGVVGPALLYEDESIQHCGMIFAQLPEFGNWHFAQHRHKGMRLSDTGGREAHISITGACLLMRLSLALEIGGFDETFVMGDFEDSDLCMKVQQRGYRCMIDTSVHLYHLERKSQMSPDLRWRMNLTLYNAWQHERRWGLTLMANSAK